MSYLDTILRDNPVGCWPLTVKTGTTAPDLGSGGNNGTINGSPTLGKTGLVFEPGGVCPDFDGVDDHVIANTSVSDPSIVVLAIHFAMTSSANMVMMSRRSTIGEYVQLSTLSGQVRFEFATSESSAVELLSGATYNDGKPHLALGVADKSGRHRFYVDGVEVARSNQVMTGSWAASTITIGATSSPGVSAHFAGKLGYAAEYHARLTPLQIRKHYRAGLPTGLHKEILDLAGLELYLPLNEASGDALDWSGNDRNGTLTANITQGASGHLAYDEATAYQMGADHEGVTFSSFPSMTNTATFGCVVKSSQISTDRYLFDGVGAAQFAFFWNTSTSGQLGVFSSAAYHNFGAAPNDDLLHFIVFVVNGTSCDCYVDGVKFGSTATVTALDWASMTSMALGHYSGGAGNYDFQGDKQCAFLASSALTPAQIRRLSMASRTLIEDRGYPKVIANLTPSFYMRLGEASGTVAYDDSGNDNDGTISGSPVLANADGPLHQSRLKGMTFDGVDDVVVVPDDASLDATTALSGFVWANLEALQSGSNHFWSKWFSTSNQRSFLFRPIHSGVYKMRLSVSGDGSSSEYREEDTEVLPDGNMHLFGFSYDAGTIKLFRDGAEVASTDSGTIPSSIFVSTSDLRFGNLEGTADYLACVAGEAGLFPSVITPQQFKQIYEAGRSRFVAEVISYEPDDYYRSIEPSGSVADNLGSNSTAGTYVGSPNYQNSGPLNNEISYAIGLDGSNDVMEMNQPILPTELGNAFSFFMFVNDASAAADDTLFSQYLAASGNRTVFHINGVSHPNKVDWWNGTDGIVVVSTSDILGTGWRFVGVSTNSSNSMQLFVDALMEDEGTLSTPAYNGSSIVGGVAGLTSNRADMSYAEVMSFSTDLTDQQILDIYEMASFSLFFGFQGTLSESLAAEDWIARAHRLNDGALVGEAVVSSNGVFEIPAPVGTSDCLVTMMPQMGSRFVDGATYSVGDYVFASDLAETGGHIQKCTVGGVAGAEPAWNESGGTSVTGACTFQDMGEIPETLVRGPVRPQ